LPKLGKTQNYILSIHDANDDFILRNPTPDGDLVKWEPTDSYPLKFLRIGNKDYANQPMVAMEKGLLEERAEFWASLKAHHAAKPDKRDEL
jgi:hypothetical protein